MNGTPVRNFDPITLQVIWSRLIAIVDEAGAALMRTAFSHHVREAQDFACVLMDARGDALAQSTVSIPSFNGTLPMSVRHFLQEYPPESLEPGDVIIGNDPWIGTGHLNDITTARPIFRHGRIVAFAGTIAHVPDIGGRIRQPDNKELFEEGLLIPICKVVRAGAVNEDVFKFLRRNVRVPEQVLGDLQAQLAANELLTLRLGQLLEEYALDDVAHISGEILGRTERATREAIRRLPNGSYSSSVGLDGLVEPLRVCVRIDVRDDELEVDFTGTSPQVHAAVNSVLNYTEVYTAFTLKCLLAPMVPNNEGSLRPIRVSAPPGTILSALPPVAVGARMMTGHFVPPAIFQALAGVVPHQVPAAAGSPMPGIQFAGRDLSGRPFAYLIFVNGGTGATAGADGLSARSFPTNTSNAPVELIEHQTPLLVEERGLIPDSGGPGRLRGGLGQTFRARVRGEHPMTLAFLAERTRTPPPGIFGGEPGRPVRALLNGEPADVRSQYRLVAGDTIQLDSAGGGGYGPPVERAAEALHYDMLRGLATTP